MTYHLSLERGILPPGLLIHHLLRSRIQLGQDRLKFCSICQISTFRTRDTATNRAHLSVVYKKVMEKLIGGPVQFDNIRRSCFVMQSIHILCDDEIHPLLPLKLCDAQMSSIGNAVLELLPSNKVA